MRIYSEKTKKEYKSVDECLAAEKQYDEAQAKAAAEAKELADARKVRAKEVEAAFDEVRKAERKYADLRNAFIKDYGSFHMTFSDSTTSNLENFFEDLLNIF